MPEEVVIYTDGACQGNPGPGGYGVVLRRDGDSKELSGGFCLTTNNRMELLAAIKGLEELDELEQSCRVTVYSDSRYVVDGMAKGWAKSWRKRNWMRHRGGPAANPDLWARLLDLCELHKVEFRWVPGHFGVKDNERCDRLAWTASREPDLPDDPGYGQPPSSSDLP